jgi:hypothetical protein
LDRRSFISDAWRLVLAALVVPSGALAAVMPDRPRHPEPRPDVDGSKVLAKDTVAPHVAELFDEIRRVPHFADGVACRCGCGEIPGMRSLLSCYEGVGMAQFCLICEGDGRLVVRLHGEGRTLAEIRSAIDGRA